MPEDVLNKSVKDTKLAQITARSKDFSSYAKDHSSLSTSDSDKTLEGDIDKTVKVSDKNLQDIKDFIARNVYNGKEYQLSDLSSDNMAYEQTFEGYPIMNNSKARLTFNLNNGKATSYKQTAMNNIHMAEGSNSSKKQVISPRKAVEALYYNRYLKQHDQVIDARLGYYSVVKETNVQPTTKLGNQSQTPWQRQHRNLLRRSHRPKPKSYKLRCEESA